MQRGCTFKCTLIKGAMLSLEDFVHYNFLFLHLYCYNCYYIRLNECCETRILWFES
nr:MAG TPA: hypothetical protein [Caudoviricetes sp.]